MSDLKEAYQKFNEKIGRDKERERRKQLEAKKSSSKEKSKPVDLAVKELTILNKFEKIALKAPTNQFREEKGGIFFAPVMVQGSIKKSTLIGLDEVVVHTLGGGFFLFERLPIAYCESGLSAGDRQDKLDKILVEHNRKIMDRRAKISFPDRVIFKDKASPNIDFMMAFTNNVINRTGISSIDQVGFPWAAKTPSKKDPKHKRADLDSFINEHPEMIAIKNSGLKQMRRQKKAKTYLNDKEEIANKLRRELKEARLNIYNIPDQPTRLKMLAACKLDENKLSKIVSNLLKAKEAVTSSKEEIKNLRADKEELTKRLREEYVETIKRKSRRSKRKATKSRKS